MRWSLEHIHAQQSESMRKQEEWKIWLKSHIPCVRAVDGPDSELAVEMEEAANAALTYDVFAGLQEQAIQKLSPQGSSDEYIHGLSNMALLNTGDNAALSNSVFAVKRDKIIEMDKEDQVYPLLHKNGLSEVLHAVGGQPAPLLGRGRQGCLHPDD